MSWSKYIVQKKQEYSGGTWVDVVPSETRQGRKIGNYPSYEECIAGSDTRWVNVDINEDYWCDECPVYSGEYLTFRARGNTKFKLSGNTVQYSLDSGSTWTSLASDTYSPTIQSGDTIMWKATLTPVDYTGIGTFVSSGSTFDAEGNPMSLLYGDNFSGQTDLSGKNDTFNRLFSCCIKMVSAENLVLPATTLSNYCYWRMFEGCTSLTTAPELLGTTLTNGCYQYMFSGCTSLTTAPELPATTLAQECYSGMFIGCTNLTTAPELPATTLASQCYAGMFIDCTSLTSAPSLPATTLANYCYQSMFNGCTSLTTAPQLPATTLAQLCYSGMFANCTSLTTIPSNMLPATTLSNSCYYQMFYYCTSLTTAPSLPATRLSDFCYAGMFYGCSNLNYVKCLATDISATDCTKNWLYGVSSLGTFVKNINMSNWTSGTSGIPSNWTIQNA